MLAQHGNDDVWIAARRHAHEPGVGAGVTGSQAGGAGAMVHDLRGAGLAGEVDAFQVDGRSGAGGGGRGHGFGDGLPVGGRNGDDAIAGAGVGLVDGLEHLRWNFVGKDDVRALEGPAGGDSAERAGELQGRDGDGALADADRDHLAGVPLLMLRLELPGGGGHGAGDFVGKVDAGLLREPYRGGVPGDGVDAELFGEVVVEGVAGPRDGVVDIDHAVMLVAGEEVTEEGAASVAHDVHVLRDALFQACERHDDLERGARCELSLDGLVQQGMVRVGDDLVPVGAGEADGELVGVEGRARDHGEDLAGVRIHGD